MVFSECFAWYRYTFDFDGDNVDIGWSCLKVDSLIRLVVDPESISTVNGVLLIVMLYPLVFLSARWNTYNVLVTVRFTFTICFCFVITQVVNFTWLICFPAFVVVLLFILTLGLICFWVAHFFKMSYFLTLVACLVFRPSTFWRWVSHISTYIFCTWFWFLVVFSQISCFDVGTACAVFCLLTLCCWRCPCSLPFVVVVLVVRCVVLLILIFSQFLLSFVQWARFQ